MCLRLLGWLQEAAAELLGAGKDAESCNSGFGGFRLTSPSVALDPDRNADSLRRAAPTRPNPKHLAASLAVVVTSQRGVALHRKPGISSFAFLGPAYSSHPSNSQARCM